jgi:hypothetical protein
MPGFDYIPTCTREELFYRIHAFAEFVTHPTEPWHAQVLLPGSRWWMLETPAAGSVCPLNAVGFCEQIGVPVKDFEHHYGTETWRKNLTQIFPMLVAQTIVVSVLDDRDVIVVTPKARSLPFASSIAPSIGPIGTSSTNDVDPNYLLHSRQPPSFDKIVTRLCPFAKLLQRDIEDATKVDKTMNSGDDDDDGSGGGIYIGNVRLRDPSDPDPALELLCQEEVFPPPPPPKQQHQQYNATHYPQAAHATALPAVATAAALAEAGAEKMTTAPLTNTNAILVHPSAASAQQYAATINSGSVVQVPLHMWTAIQQQLQQQRQPPPQVQVVAPALPPTPAPPIPMSIQIRTLTDFVRNLRQQEVEPTEPGISSLFNSLAFEIVMMERRDDETVKLGSAKGGLPITYRRVYSSRGGTSVTTLNKSLKRALDLMAEEYASRPTFVAQEIERRIAEFIRPDGDDKGTKKKRKRKPRKPKQKKVSANNNDTTGNANASGTAASAEAAAAAETHILDSDGTDSDNDEEQHPNIYHRVNGQFAKRPHPNIYRRSANGNFSPKKLPPSQQIQDHATFAAVENNGEVLELNGTDSPNTGQSTSRNNNTSDALQPTGATDATADHHHGDDDDDDFDEDVDEDMVVKIRQPYKRSYKGQTKMKPKEFQALLAEADNLYPSTDPDDDDEDEDDEDGDGDEDEGHDHASFLSSPAQSLS